MALCKHQRLAYPLLRLSVSDGGPGAGPDGPEAVLDEASGCVKG